MPERDLSFKIKINTTPPSIDWLLELLQPELLLKLSTPLSLVIKFSVKLNQENLEDSVLMLVLATMLQLTPLASYSLEDSSRKWVLILNTKETPTQLLTMMLEKILKTEDHSN